MTAIAIAAWSLLTGYWDARCRRLPNLLTVPAAGIGLAYALATQQAALGALPWGQVGLGAGVALLLTLPGFALGKLGGGDVKLLLAIGLLGGLPAVLTSFVVSALGIAGLFIALLGTERLAVWPALPQGLRAGLQRLPSAHRVRLPFGAGLCAGLLGYIAWLAGSQ